MKKLITIYLIAITFASNAQDKKPTKEQTVAFIKDYFANNHIGTGVQPKSKTVSANIQYSDFKIDFNVVNNLMTINYNELGDYYDTFADYRTKIYEKRQVLFNFSKIEKISLLVENRFSDVFEVDLYIENSNGIHYYEVQNTNNLSGFSDLELPKVPKKSNYIRLPINCYAAPSNFDHENGNKKILQAFNHLRKLCGAPEPINFED